MDRTFTDSDFAAFVEYARIELYLDQAQRILRRRPSEQHETLVERTRRRNLQLLFSKTRGT